MPSTPSCVVSPWGETTHSGYIYYNLVVAACVMVLYLAAEDISRIMLICSVLIFHYENRRLRPLKILLIYVILLSRFSSFRILSVRFCILLEIISLVLVCHTRICKKETHWSQMNAFVNAFGKLLNRRQAVI